MAARASFHPTFLWLCNSSPLICFPVWEAKLLSQVLAFRVPERGFAKKSPGQICQGRIGCHCQCSWGRGKSNDAFIFLSKYPLA